MSKNPFTRFEHNTDDRGLLFAVDEIDINAVRFTVSTKITEEELLKLFDAITDAIFNQR